MNFINLTSSEVVIYSLRDCRVSTRLQVCGLSDPFAIPVARFSPAKRPARTSVSVVDLPPVLYDGVDEIPLCGWKFAKVSNLPAYDPNKPNGYIVDAAVVHAAKASGRPTDDLYLPAWPVYANDSSIIVGYAKLMQMY